MSPLKINMLLFIHCNVDIYDRRNGEAQREAYHEFLSEKLIETCPEGTGAILYGQTYRTTDRGRAMVEALKAVELPVCKWVQPD